MGKYIWVATAALMVSSCANGFSGARPLTYKEPAETRVLVSYDGCPDTSQEGEQFAPLVAAIAVGAATSLLEGFGNALSNAAQGGALPSSIAASNTEVTPKYFPKCLIIVRGDLEPAPDASKIKEWLPNTKFDGSYRPAGGGKKAKLPMVKDLHHLLQLQIINSRNNEAFTFAPVLTYVKKSMDGSKKGSRELSVAVQFARPDKDKPTGGVVLIGNRQIGQIDTYKPLENSRHPYESPWFKGVLLAADKAGGAAGNLEGDDKKENSGRDNAVESPPPKLETAEAVMNEITPLPPAPSVPSDGIDLGAIGSVQGGGSIEKIFVPVTITTTVIETRPTKEFLAFVASVFNKNAKPVLDSKLKSALDPATIEKEVNDAFDAEAAYVTAYGAAQEAIINYCALKGLGMDKNNAASRIKASSSARNLQILANKAAVAADRERPYSPSKFINASDQEIATANPSPFCS